MSEFCGRLAKMDSERSAGRGRLTRNFCIIAHIDHGKSTLADRFIEQTNAIDERKMNAQILDTLDLERERGITIKAQPMRMTHRARDGELYAFNLLDTPGHVDFNYEVSRSLAACEGAILLVDATQGVEAQTVSNVFLALEQGLEIIPAINKIDMPNADFDAAAAELKQAFGMEPASALPVSAKTGEGVDALMQAIVDLIPPPTGDAAKPLAALVFDYKYDVYKGVIASARVFDGELTPGKKLKMMSTNRRFEALETGFFNPEISPQSKLVAGEVGYIATGLKDLRGIQVGDTVTAADKPAPAALPGYKELKPVVFTGVYPSDSDNYKELRDALTKLQLNDAALSYEPSSSLALGLGFRCGFLGMLHMEVTQERLEREFGLTVINTSPTVSYKIDLTDGATVTVDNPAKMPAPQSVKTAREPWAKLSMVTPAKYVGGLMELLHARRGEYRSLEYLQDDFKGADAERRRVLLSGTIPLSELIIGFHDDMKSLTSGYASLEYSVGEYRPADLVKLDVLINQQRVDELSLLVDKSKAQRKAHELAGELKKVIQRQLFEVPIQIAVGNKVIARETIKALRKNVLAKCYGGDVTRKKKLLEKQAKGKRRMKMVGRVEIPQEAFMSVMKLGS